MSDRASQSLFAHLCAASFMLWLAEMWALCGSARAKAAAYAIKRRVREALRIAQDHAIHATAEHIVAWIAKYWRAPTTFQRPRTPINAPSGNLAHKPSASRMRRLRRALFKRTGDVAKDIAALCRALRCPSALRAKLARVMRRRKRQSCAPIVVDCAAPIPAAWRNAARALNAPQSDTS